LNANTYNARCSGIKRLVEVHRCSVQTYNAQRNT